MESPSILARLTGTLATTVAGSLELSHVDRRDESPGIPSSHARHPVQQAVGGDAQYRLLGGPLVSFLRCIFCSEHRYYVWN